MKGRGSFDMYVYISQFVVFLMDLQYQVVTNARWRLYFMMSLFYTPNRDIFKVFRTSLPHMTSQVDLMLI